MRPGRDRPWADRPAEESLLFGSGAVGLLSWQVCFLAWLTGTWALREPQAALAAAETEWLEAVEAYEALREA